MALPELTQKQIEKALEAFCERRVPKHVRNQVSLKFAFRDETVTLSEMRPVSDNPTRSSEIGIAQFRFDPKKNAWRLYYMDQNSRWKAYERLEPSSAFDPLLAEVDRDPTGIFWG